MKNVLRTDEHGRSVRTAVEQSRLTRMLEAWSSDAGVALARKTNGNPITATELVERITKLKRY